MTLCTRADAPSHQTSQHSSRVAPAVFFHVFQREMPDGAGGSAARGGARPPLATMSSQPQGCPERTGKKKKGGRGTQKRAVKVCMADGACWKGQVDQNRLPHGAGVMTYPSGDRLEGTFVAGAAEGQGYTYVFADGRRVEADYGGGGGGGGGVQARKEIVSTIY